MQDHVGAFVSQFDVAGAAGGPLAGLTFAAKDIFDVAGHVTGCGSPAWAGTHAPAQAHAAPVARLLAAGARLVGKSHTDELAYSLMGVNAHYGTPLNSAAPERIPGGSSSGSVAATAAGLVDIGLGSDTGGSVRLPASFCGVWGLRTTHGAIPMAGTMPLAPSFDTVGWFARDAGVMDRVAAAFGLPDPVAGPVQMLLPVDGWAMAEAPTVAALAPVLAGLEGRLGAARPVVIAPDGLDLWFDAFRTCQAAEIWQAHGDWIASARPAFGPGVAERFAMAAAITEPDWAKARATRDIAAERLLDLTRDGAVLVLPASPSPAPRRSADATELETFRRRALHLLCAAGLAGLPQISIPAGLVDGAPVGLSLVGAPGSDRTLVSLAGG